MTITKQQLGYTIILLLIQFFFAAHALEPGALNPARPSYQLPKLP